MNYCLSVWNFIFYDKWTGSRSDKNAPMVDGKASVCIFDLNELSKVPLDAATYQIPRLLAFCFRT